MKNIKKLLLVAVLAVLSAATVWGQASVNTKLWEETWTGGAANTTPSNYTFSGTTVYNSATLTYTQSDSNTKLYAEALAGGTSPELLLSKSNKTWTISNIPTGQAEEMSLTFLSNKTTFDVTSTTSGITISGSQKSWTISSTNSVSSFNLTIKNTGSSNARLDNIVLIVTKAGSSGSSAVATTTTIDASGITNTDVYTSTHAGSLSATVKDNNNTTIGGATVTWSGNNDEVATINATTGAVTLVGIGTVTFTASYAGSEGEYQSSSATYEMTVTDSSNLVSTLTFTAACGGSGTADDGAVWTVTSDGQESTFDNTKGIHYGTSKAEVTYIRLLTSVISGTIKQVVVNAATASNVTATVGVTVGGNTFGGDPKSLSTSATDYTFQGSASGQIIVTVTKPSSATGALYVKSIVVTYSSGPVTYSVTYDANGATSGSVPTDATAYESGATVTVLGNTGNLAKAGYIYAGWNLNAGGTGTNYTAGNTFSITDNITLYAKWDPKTITGLSYTGTPTKTQYSAGEAFDPTGLTVTASFNDESQENVTSQVVWTPNPLTTGTTSVTGTYMDQSINVSGLTVTAAKGSEDNPYSVAEARAAIDAGTGITNVYVQGIISQIDSYNDTYHSITYWISADGSTSGQLEVYSGKGLNGADFSKKEDLTVGATVVVFGNLKKYNDTYEFDYNNYLVSYSLPVNPVITAEDISIAYNITGGSIPYDITSPVEGGTMTASTTADWLSIGDNADSSFPFTCTVNDGNADRTATVTLTYTYSTDKTVTKDVTITQSKMVVDYATLPFEFDGIRNDIANTTGLTQSGIGSDYSSSPKLKFDTEGDYLILKLNEVPGKLTFNIKGNNLSGSYIFSVLESANGTDYTTLKEYTSISGSTSTEELSPAFTTRYIKWEYTTKATGNVALGKISLAKAVPVITIDVDAPVAVSATEGSGTLALSYSFFDVSSASDFAVQFYDANDDEVSDPDWITVEVAATQPSGYEVTYSVTANPADERTAYFKVFALAGDDYVFSNIVTITQAEHSSTSTTSDYSKFTGELVEGDYIIYYNGYALKNVNVVSSNRLSYEEVTPSNNVITTGDASIVWHIARSGDYWTIYNTAVNAYAASTSKKNEAQMLADGTSDNAKWSVTGSETYDFENLARSEGSDSNNKWLRLNEGFGFGCYSNSTGGKLTLYKFESDDTPIIVNCRLHNGRYWATYYNSSFSYKLPAGAKAFTLNSDHNLYLLGDGSIIPANTAVIIIADTDSLNLENVPNSGSITPLGGGNILMGSDSVVEKDNTQYVLGIKNGEMSFYKFNGIEIPANKAYYVVNN